MKSKKLLFVAMLLLIASLLSGCSSSALGTNSWSGLNADGEKAYLTNGALVYAVYLKNGSMAWQYPADKAEASEAYFATPILTNDGQLLVVSTGTSHSFVSLNKETGVVNWRFLDSEGTWIGAPLVLDEVIYAPNSDGKLYAFAMDGTFLWAKHIGGALWSQPVSDGEVLYLNSLDHYLYAFDIVKQEVIWSVEMSGAAPGNPLIAETGMIYAGTLGAKLEAIDPVAKSIEWRFDTQGWVWDGLTLDEETLFVGDLDGNFYSLNATDGSLIWGPITPDGTILGKPLVTENYVVIATESGTAYAIESNGKIAWNYAIGGKLYTSPVQSDGLLLFAPMAREDNAILVALDTEGKQVWQFVPQK